MLKRILKNFRKSPEISNLSSADLGKYGEDLAAKYLKRQGYRIVVRNFLAPLGRSRTGRKLTGEIDVIAYDREGILCFIEVKTRRRVEVASPESAVDLQKQRQISKTARLYRRILQLGDEPYRFDVVAIRMEVPGMPVIELLAGYFSEVRFARGRWWKTY